jgi:transcriptional regulator with GAF, ATPase, and Fis domain
MTEFSEQADGNAAFSFERDDNWVRFSADLGQMCHSIGEQVRRAVAEIDVDGIVDEVRRALADVAAEASEASANWRSAQQWSGPTRVRVDIRADAPASPGERTAPSQPEAERKTVLDLLAQGKINAAEAARLLDALGG